MKLQNRDLSLRMRGEDIALLHKELKQLEYAIAENELQRMYFGTTTRQAVLDFQKKQDLEGSGIVDKETAKRINEALESGDLEYRVKGTVSLADGTPATGLRVSAFDRDLRSEQLLGKHRTDRRGFYEITYYARQFRRLEKGSADLVVKVFADDGGLLAVSQILFNAPRNSELDLTIPADAVQPLMLFEKIGRAIAPLLDDLKIEGLEEDQRHQDVTFLGGETGFEINDIARFVMAHKLAEHYIQPEFWFALLGGSFFQYTENQSLKEQLAAILDSLSSLDAAAVRKALTRSFNLKEIPETFREKVTDWVEALLKFIASRSVSRAEKPTFVKLALEHARIKGAKKQEKFARLFNEHKALTPKLLEALEKDSSFKKAEIADLRTSFRLTELTQGDFSVVKVIKEEFGIRQPEKIRTLA
ncbi:MAG: peptidoglycan-binding protein, partial [Proteobacteria bacterium]|nr:peptidoglycan-binding protein [Pseudomonadota bacterium]